MASPTVRSTTMRLNRAFSPRLLQLSDLTDLQPTVFLLPPVERRFWIRRLAGSDRLSLASTPLLRNSHNMLRSESHLQGKTSLSRPRFCLKLTLTLDRGPVKTRSSCDFTESPFEAFETFSERSLARLQCTQWPITCSLQLIHLKGYYFSLTKLHPSVFESLSVGPVTM
jgi:hypothetical protein